MTISAPLVSALLCVCTALLPGQKKLNIIVILADDMGFSDIGCYGSEIQTPNLDHLAADGVRLTQFYNTARCCPTRACLLTGLYPHQAGVGWMMSDLKHPGYRGRLNRSCVTMAEVLGASGYSTYMCGKWHVTPKVQPNGPKGNWPLQRGFDRFYGTIHGAGSFFDPNSLTRGNKQISPYADPEYQPKQYYYTDAISDHAVRYVNEHCASAEHRDKPFFMYVAYTAAHWPMHALPKDIAKYKGKYDGGYEPIRKARHERLKKLGLVSSNWNLTQQAASWEAFKHKEWDAVNMEVYAAMVDNMDQGIGRIVAALSKNGQLDNTLLMYMQDNGGCAEGMGRGGKKRRAAKPTLDPMPADELQTNMIPKQTRDGYPVLQGTGVMAGPADTYIGYGRGWANVSNTPYREYKHWVHEGGIATPLVVHWPKGIPSSQNGKLVHEPGHLIDIMATCVAVSGASYPKTFHKGDQAITPMEGLSLAPLFRGEDIQRDALYWEHEGNVAIRVGKWKAVAKFGGYKRDAWELYDMVEDRTETNNLAKQMPARLVELKERWRTFAEKANFLPVHGGRGVRKNANKRKQARKKDKAARPFNGRNLSGWTAKQASKSQWAVAHPAMSEANPKTLERTKGEGPMSLVNLVGGHGPGSDLYTTAKFGDCRIELEVMVAKGSNSGIYVMGEYEIQVLDSFGRKKLGMGDMGAIYGVAIPSTNASRAPGTWQRFRIDFRAPRFDASGKKTKNARFLKIELNGQVVQQNAEAKGVTPGGVSGREAATGPLMFQGNHGPVAYRNIVITPLGKAQATSLAIPKTDEGLPGTGTIRRYGWFQKLWLRKREAWAVSVAADQNALVFLGDSITQGWGDKMGNSFPGVKVANRGISGDTTRGMLVRLESDVLALNPSGVVMLMGTNDLEEKATAESIAGNVRLIIDRLEAHNPKMPIILCKVFPSSASKRRSAKDIRRINKLIAAAVNGDAQVTLLETWKVFANAQGDAKKAEFPDLLHPNKDGYAIWAAALRPILSTHGFVETKPAPFEPAPGFESLFNGKDLTGWGFRQKKTLAKRATFDGKTGSTRRRYIAKNGRLVVTTPAEGRRVQQLWTTREFAEDFVLKLQFRATPNADSGVFIRGRQLQCRDYPLAGPYKGLKNFRPQDWNDLEIVVKGNIAHCTCNGEVLEAAFKVPESGPIGLEGDRGQLEYRRIRIKVSK